MNHTDPLYPAWNKVRAALQDALDAGRERVTTGEAADAVVEALRAELTNDTTELTRRLHVGAAAAGWFDTLRAFVRAVRTAHGEATCSVIELPDGLETEDGWRLTHAVLVNLWMPDRTYAQVSWRLTSAQAQALTHDDGVARGGAGAKEPLLPYDGHDRALKYERLQRYAQGRK